MNRQQRRGMEAQARKDSGEPIPSADAIARFLVARMAQRSKDVLDQLRAAVGAEPKSGHVVDALMTEAARFEQALMAQRFADAMDAAVCVLFLARDLAIREGKIRIEKMAQA